MKSAEKSPFGIGELVESLEDERDKLKAKVKRLERKIWELENGKLEHYGKEPTK